MSNQTSSKRRLAAGILIAAFAISGIALGVTLCTAEPEAEETEHRRVRKLCDIDGGLYCSPRDITNGDGRLADEGWLCCAISGSPCVSANISDECAGGDIGWCEHYLEDEHGIATCYD